MTFKNYQVYFEPDFILIMYEKDHGFISSLKIHYTYTDSVKS